MHLFLTNLRARWHERRARAALAVDVAAAITHWLDHERAARIRWHWQQQREARR